MGSGLKVYSVGPDKNKPKKTPWQKGVKKVKTKIRKVRSIGSRVKKKVKNLFVRKEKNEFYYTGKYISKKAKKYHKVYARTLSRNYEPNYKRRNHLSVRYQAREKLIDTLIEAKAYDFENPLVLLNPYDVSPLCALVVFTTDKEYAVRATVKGDEPRFDVSGKVSKAALHRVPIVGLYAGRENEVVIELLSDNDEVVESKIIKIRTKPLPAVLENMVTVYKDSGDTAYPLIYVAGKGTKLPYAFDQSGTIRYYLDYRPRGYGLFPLANGRFLFIDRDVLVPTFEIPHSSQVYEMDWFGRVYKTYQVAKGAHHDVFEKEDGNIMFVSNSLDIHMEDIVTEIDRNNGKIVQSIDMRDVLGDDFRDYQNWVHCNSCQHDAKTNRALISPRNVHSVINIDWDTGKLNWILCDPRFWENTDLYDKVLKPIGDVEYQYQQHSAFFIHDDLDGNPDTIHIMVFDNHWHMRRKLDFFDNDNSSYVKIFTINEKEMTVKLEHKYEGIKSKITSNGLIDFKNKRVFSMGAFLAEQYDGDRNGMIYEYDYDTEEPLNQYGIKDNYYRAYQFKPNYDQLATRMEKDDNYVVGHLEAPMETTEIVKTNKKAPKKSKNYCVQYEDDVYVHCIDHNVKKVYFKGKNTSYIKDLSNTEQTREQFKEMEYFIAIPLKDVKSDEYQIYIMNENDTWYDTKAKIKITD